MERQAQMHGQKHVCKRRKRPCDQSPGRYCGKKPLQIGDENRRGRTVDVAFESRSENAGTRPIAAMQHALISVN